MVPVPVTSEAAPAAIGPYAQAVRVGDLVFTSGQIPLDPGTGQLVSGDVKVQTRRVLDNLKAVLAAAGTGVERVVKATVYLADLNDFAAMNEVYGEVFDATKPARSTVQVARLPRDARVEIDLVAVVAGAAPGT